MFKLDMQSRTPIYEQLKEQITDLVVIGVLEPGDQLPSVRSLARDLGVNPNTVQKAYQDLEREQVIHSVSGIGSFISSHDLSRRKIQIQFLEKFKAAARDVMNSGTSLEEAVETVRGVYKEGMAQ